MSIRTLYSKEHGHLTRSLVEVTEDHPLGGVARSTAWEVHCDRCGEMYSGLTEAESLAEIREHRCVKPDESSRSVAGH